MISSDHFNHRRRRRRARPGQEQTGLSPECYSVRFTELKSITALQAIHPGFHSA